MVLTWLRPAQETPSGVFGLPVEFALPVAVLGMLILMILIMFYLVMRGTPPTSRVDTMEAFAALLRSVGEVIKVCLEAVAQVVNRRPPSDT